MNTFDAITLQSFLQAIAQQRSPLPAEMQQSLHQLGDRLDNRLNNPPTEASDVLRSFIKQYPSLERSYNTAYQQYQTQYQTQERTKSLAIGADGFFTPGFSENNFVDLLRQVLNDTDPPTAAQQVSNRLSPRAVPARQSSFLERGDRVVAMAAGGAAIGTLFGHIPGAIIGAVLGAIYGWYSSNEKTSPGRKN